MKGLLWRTSPRLYDRLITITSSPSIRALAGTRNRLTLQRLLTSKQPFRIDVCCRAGFGATLSQIVILHHYFLGHPGFRGLVCSNPLYSEGNSSEDMLGLFFDRTGNAPDADCATIPFRFQSDISLKPLDEGLAIQNAHELFCKYYAIKLRFIHEAQEFFNSNFRDVVGLHFRGSDKRLEAPRVEFGTIAKTLDICMDSSGIDRIFVATDELEFLTFVQRRYGKCRVLALDCQYLSDGVSGAHYKPGSGFEKGREALLSILILSMCTICVRGVSHLSAWAKILNPQLPIVMYNQPFPVFRFPEREISKDCERPLSRQ
jgi:hypothetical protein